MPSPPPLRQVLVIVFLALGFAACAGTASSAPGSTLPPERVTKPEQAIARVIAEEPRLTGIAAFDTGLIGQSSSYTVQPASGGSAFVVTVQVGWGDYEAGCINEHIWVLAVTPDGVMDVVRESGPPVPSDAWPSPAGAGKIGISGTAVAGPVCPVETVPPDPGCAPRPVAGAEIVIRDLARSEVARATTQADGSFFVELQAGDYLVEPQPVEGLLGTAAPVEVSVVGEEAIKVNLEYDTGIR